MATDVVTPAQTCARCGSPDILPLLPLRQYGEIVDTVSVHVFGKQKSEWKNPVSASSRIVARVCGACGYTELFAENHKELWKTYQKMAR